MVNIGNRIKAARQEKGISQEELAQVIGATKSAVSRYEAGKRQPRYDQLQRIATALEVPIQELMDLEDLKQAVIYGKGIGGEMEGCGIRGGSEALEDIPVEPTMGVDFGGGEVVSSNGHRTYVVPNISCRLDFGISKQINKDPQLRIATALGKLNEEGQEKAAERVEELTEIPRYQATTAPESTPPPTEGQGTTPPSDAPETAPEGRTHYVTMICPICGQHFMGPAGKTGMLCTPCRTKHKGASKK